MEAWRQQITDYQFKSFLPFNEKYRNSDEIRISVKSQEAYTVPQDSRIIVRGEWKLNRNAGVAADAPSTDFQFVNNYIAQLFDRVRYIVNNVEVDSMKSLGITSTVKTYLTNTAAETVGLTTAGWKNVNSNDADKTFCAIVPLSMISGFASDFKDVLIKVPQDLVLVRSRTDRNAIFCGTAANANNQDIAINITSIEWELPIVKFNLDYETKILTKVRRNDALKFGFRTWETHEYPKLPKTDRVLWSLPTSNVRMPKFVVLVFQTDRMDNHRSNAAFFDNVDLRSFKVQLNNRVIPEKDIVEDFEKGRYLSFYRNYVDFMTDYWRGEKLSEPALTIEEYKIHAIFVIKCVYEEVIKTGPMDITLIIEANKNFPDNTAAYAILVNEVRYSYELLNGIVKRID